MSLSFPINDTHTLSYQSPHTASLLTNSVSVLSELQAHGGKASAMSLVTRFNKTAVTEQRNHKKQQEKRGNFSR